MKLRDITSILESFDTYTMLYLFQNMTDDEDMSPELLLWTFCHATYYNSEFNKLRELHAARDLSRHIFFELADMITYATE